MFRIKGFRLELTCGSEPGLLVAVHTPVIVVKVVNVVVVGMVTVVSVDVVTVEVVGVETVVS